MAAMADPIEESMLHMVIPEDGARTPSFTFFGDPDYFFQSSGSATPVIGAGFAWKSTVPPVKPKPEIPIGNP